MQKKTINISVPQSMADFIEREVESGEYASTSDFLRTLIRDYRALRGRSYTRAELMQAVRDGAESGESAPLDMGEVIGEAERRFRALDRLAKAKARVKPTPAQAAKSVEEQEREVFDEVRAMRREYAEGRDR